MTDKLASYGVARRWLRPGVRLHADEYHREMAIRFTTWNQVVILSTTA